MDLKLCKLIEPIDLLSLISNNDHNNKTIMYTYIPLKILYNGGKVKYKYKEKIIDLIIPAKSHPPIYLNFINNLTIICLEKKSKYFTKNMNDLIYTKKMNIWDALCSKGFIIKHLNGEKLLINQYNNNVITNNTINVLNKYGFESNGKLIIKYNIIYPVKLSINEYNIVNRLTSKIKNKGGLKKKICDNNYNNNNNDNICFIQ